PRSDRDPPRDSQEPARQVVPPPDRPGPGGQDEERRLEGVLGVVGVAQNVAADVGPCRATSASNAASVASPLRARNRVRSWSSGGFPAAPRRARILNPPSSSAPAVRRTIGRVSCDVSPESAGWPRGDSNFLDKSPDGGVGGSAWTGRGVSIGLLAE